TGVVRGSRSRAREGRLAGEDPRRSPIVEVADYMGIIPEYVDQTGREARVTSDETRRALLSALGVDAATDEEARASLVALRDRDRQQLIAPVRVVEYRDAAAGVLPVRLPLTRAAGGP